MTDLMMPRVSGLELVAAFRANPRLAAPPVIVLSASVAVRPAVARTFDSATFLAKPFSVDELCTSVDQLFRRTESHGYVDLRVA